MNIHKKNFWNKKSIWLKKKEKSSKNKHKLHENSLKKIFSNEKSIYDSKKKKNRGGVETSNEK